MILIKASLRDNLLENHWGLLMVKCLALMKAPLERAWHGWEYTSWSWGRCSAVLGAMLRVKLRS